MKKIEPKYPWCTGAPRPTILANMDAEEVIISYYTAPICQTQCKTALIKLHGVIHIEIKHSNDQNCEYIKNGMIRDYIYVTEEKEQQKYIFLFHNETITVTANSIEQMPGKTTSLDNLNNHHSEEYERI